MSSNAAQVKAWRQAKRGTEPPYHGTANIYLAYGCRCIPCTDANTAAAARFRARRGAQR